MKNKFETPELELHRFSVDEAILLTLSETGDGGSMDFGKMFEDLDANAFSSKV